MESFFFFLFFSSGGCHTAQCRDRSLNWSIVLFDYSAPAAAAAAGDEEEAPGAHTQTLEELQI